VVSCRVSELTAFAWKTLRPWTRAVWPNLQTQVRSLLESIAVNEIPPKRTSFRRPTTTERKDDFRGPLILRTLIQMYKLNLRGLSESVLSQLYKRGPKKGD
jgi:hypothetical protein